jgi:hypothetical protein
MVTVWLGCPGFGSLASSSEFTHVHVQCCKHDYKHIHCYKDYYKHCKAAMPMLISSNISVGNRYNFDTVNIFKFIAYYFTFFGRRREKN